MASPNYLKYLAGDPVNEELANLKAGRLPDLFQESQAVAGALRMPNFAPGDPEAPLTREERIALRELRLSPGWPVLHKLLERAAATYRRAAILLSETDPLAKDLADLWLSVKLSKELSNRFMYAVAVEIEAGEETTHETHSAIGRAQT